MAISMRMKICRGLSCELERSSRRMVVRVNLVSRLAWISKGCGVDVHSTSRVVQTGDNTGSRGMEDRGYCWIGGVLTQKWYQCLACLDPPWAGEQLHTMKGEERQETTRYDM